MTIDYRLAFLKGSSLFAIKYSPFRMENCSSITSAMSPSPVGICQTFPLTTMFLLTGIQGSDIGDVKFNSDGDGLGRYSVYQYQQKKGANDAKISK